MVLENVLSTTIDNDVHPGLGEKFYYSFLSCGHFPLSQKFFFPNHGMLYTIGNIFMLFKNSDRN